MTIRVIGSSVGRTGTTSLKTALERLLGLPCYHMLEVFSHPEHIAHWHAAAEGHPVDWQALLAGYAAVVDWPAASFWPELSAAFPDAVILHSLRDAESWWESASQTIFPTSQQMAGTPWHDMLSQVLARRFTSRLDDRAACLEAYAQHNAQVVAQAAPARLLTWSPADGWAPLAKALCVPVPDEPFPRVNTREEFANLQGSGQ